jgi:putative hydrolase of HD superfamily
VHKMDGLVTGLNAVKNTPRTGWMLRGVPAAIAETIAAHMAESAIIALALADHILSQGIQVDAYHAASIAAVHDLSEAYVGDIVKRAVELIGKEAKERAEIAAAEEELGKDSILTRLIREYIQQETLEARVAKAAETLSTLLQGLRYLRAGYDVAEIVCGMLRVLERIEEPALQNAIQALFGGEIAEARRTCKKESPR